MIWLVRMAEETWVPTRKIEEILAMLPHRYPFVFIDRIIDFDAGRYLTAIKNISEDEEAVASYLPNRPIFPPPLLLEAMAQATGLLAVLSTKDVSSECNFFLIGLDKVRFPRVAESGSQLQIHVVVDRVTQGIGKFKARATIDGNTVSRAELMCAAKQ